MTQAKRDRRKERIGEWLAVATLTLAVASLVQFVITKRSFDPLDRPLTATIQVGDTVWQQYGIDGDSARLEAIAAKDPITGSIGAAFVARHCGTFQYRSRIVTQTGRLLQAGTLKPLIVTIEGC